VTLIYVDTSALVRTYLEDESDHAELTARLLDSKDPVVTSALTRVEVASAVAAAVRARRIPEPALILDRFDADCADDGPLTLLALDAETCLPIAYRLTQEHRLRTLDALHLAVALTDATELAAGEPVILVTRDHEQATAAAALGLALG